MNTFHEFISGFISGTVSALVLSPLDAFRIQRQLGNKITLNGKVLQRACTGCISAQPTFWAIFWSVRKNVKNQHFLLPQSNLMKAIMPFMPHISCECLSRLEGKNFYSKVEWPKIQKTFLVEDEVIIVVQVNGKKRGLFSNKKNMNEIDAIKEAKKIENIEKNLKNKKIIKKIFVKNKIINFITS